MRDFVTVDCELTTGAIAALTGAKMREGDPVDRPIRNIAPLDTAGASDISFLDNSKYAAELATTRAAACLIVPRFVERAPRSLVVLRLSPRLIGSATASGSTATPASLSPLGSAAKLLSQDEAWRIAANIAKQYAAASRFVCA